MELFKTMQARRSATAELPGASRRARPTSTAPGRGVLLLILGGIICCAPRLNAIPVDTGVDFAAHAAHRGLVVDKMAGASAAVLVPAGSQSWTGGPRFLLQANDKTIAAVWFPERDKMIVRGTADPQAPLIGEVDAAWKDGTIRLTLKPAEGASFQTSAFDRIDGRMGRAALGSQVNTRLSVRGVYRAELRDAQGGPAGWLRVQISPHQAARHIYDGVVPASLNGPLATAAVALLDSDVKHIENHAAVDVHLGN
ncbi:MAG: hypothetical protein ABSA52_20985 [Candidatus Binatia bacterium]|jgi:hypothetical protein